MRLREQWKQPVSRADAWKVILLTVVLLVGVLAFGQIITHSRFERVGWAILLLALWAQAGMQIFKAGWRAWQPFQTLWLVSYTFFAGGNILSQGLAASWLTNIGAFLLIVAGTIMVFDFRKSRDLIPPVPPT